MAKRIVVRSPVLHEDGWLVTRDGMLFMCAWPVRERLILPRWELMDVVIEASNTQWHDLSGQRGVVSPATASRGMWYKDEVGIEYVCDVVRRHFHKLLPASRSWTKPVVIYWRLLYGEDE